MNMSIAEQEEQLFKEWADLKASFVLDGVACEAEYKKSTRKTAFVLMEYGNKLEQNQCYDLRKNELIKPYGQGWWKVARILHGIRMLDLPPEKQVKFPDKMHPSICAFNVNKVGSPWVDPVVRALIAMKDRKFIQRQFKIYDPDLTICGGTFEIFRYTLGHENIEKKETKQEVPWYERSINKYVVDIKHPADRGRGYQYPEDVINAIKEIYRIKH